jgi:hypothetical protein
MARLGLPAVTAEQGLALFDAAVATEDAVVAPLRIDVPALKARTDELPALLRGFVPAKARRVAKTTAASADNALAHELAALVESERDRVLLDLHLRQGLDGQELADAIGTTASHAYVLMSRLRDQVERSLGALPVARLGREDCEELRAVLEGWDGAFSPLWRKRVARHVDSCEICSERRKGFLSPLSLLAAVPLVPAPLVLRDQTLDKVRNVANVRPVGAWRRPRARDGFPPSMLNERRRRPLLAAAAAALFLVPAVIVAEPWGGRGGGDPEREVAAVQRDDVTTSTEPATTTSTVAPTTTTTNQPTTPVAPPPPDVAGPSLAVSQGIPGCTTTFAGSNPIAATASDPSGIATVVLSASGSNMTSPGTQPMSPGGGGSYFSSITWNGLGTISWIVTATDNRGNVSTRSGSFVVQTTPCP